MVALQRGARGIAERVGRKGSGESAGILFGKGESGSSAVVNAALWCWHDGQLR